MRSGISDVQNSDIISIASGSSIFSGMEKGSQGYFKIHLNHLKPC